MFQFKDGYPLIQSAFVRRVQNALQNLGYSYPPNIKNTVFYHLGELRMGPHENSKNDARFQLVV